jgi:hypothetical protein
MNLLIRFIPANSVQLPINKKRAEIITKIDFYG